MTALTRIALCFVRHIYGMHSADRLPRQTVEVTEHPQRMTLQASCPEGVSSGRQQRSAALVDL